MNKLGKTKFLSLLSLIFVMCSCTAKTERHVHSFDKQWSFDSINHYHACTKEGCDKKAL